MNNHFSFFVFNEKWKKWKIGVHFSFSFWKNGCSFSTFHFPLKMENGNNGMYTDRICLCLLGISAAFDTTDQNILVFHLYSWFEMTGTIIDWFQSYLSSCLFVLNVKVVYLLFSLRTCFCSVPQGSVLSSFLSCTPPLSVHLSHLFL